MKEVVIIGYSGHGLVACDILQASGRKIVAYCDNNFKQNNIFELPYWGAENSPENIERLAYHDYFVAIGDNMIRRKIILHLMALIQAPTQAIHPTAIIASHTTIEAGVMLGARCIINPLAHIGVGTICNTASVIEHECVVGNFCHIAPTAVLCGNVVVGDGSFIGANAVVKPNVRIGRNVTVGAGAVVLSDLPDHAMVVGNPARIR
jgi:sugar O-acyltransferase (sialic acid O-acetyltransferase NeuD family)